MVEAVDENGVSLKFSKAIKAELTDSRAFTFVDGDTQDTLVAQAVLSNYISLKNGSD